MDECKQFDMLHEMRCYIIVIFACFVGSTFQMLSSPAAQLSVAVYRLKRLYWQPYLWWEMFD